MHFWKITYSGSGPKKTVGDISPGKNFAMCQRTLMEHDGKWRFGLEFLNPEFGINQGCQNINQKQNLKNPVKMSTLSFKTKCSFCIGRPPFPWKGLLLPCARPTFHRISTKKSWGKKYIRGIIWPKVEELNLTLESNYFPPFPFTSFSVKMLFVHPLLVLRVMYKFGQDKKNLFFASFYVHCSFPHIANELWRMLMSLLHTEKEKRKGPLIFKIISFMKPFTQRDFSSADLHR